ncbi:MAG: hypothetical protein KAZ88_07950 [Acidimicrobiia bacterium]|jgi:hypothetical protein|nr:hypothetical protein [Acidimicrobiia bacterium]MBP8180911.1 hypothetical protein [Acidimicrobiia bacterium]
MTRDDPLRKFTSVTTQLADTGLVGAAIGTDGAAALLAASLFPIFYLGARAVSKMASGYERAADRRRGLTAVKRKTVFQPAPARASVAAGMLLGMLALMAAWGSSSAMLIAIDNGKWDGTTLDPGQAAWLLAAISAACWAAAGRLWLGRWPRQPGGLNVWPVVALTAAAVFATTDWPSLIGSFGWIVVIANVGSAIVAWWEWFGTSVVSGGAASE